VSAVELVSPLPPEECAARLREATDNEGLLSWFRSRPVIGRVSGRSVRLRKRIGYGNSFQAILVGRLEERDGGTVFRGKAGVSTFVTIFMAAWFCGVGLLGGAMSVIAIGEMLGVKFGERPMERSLALPLVAVIAPLMLTFGVGLVRFGRWLARDEERFLVAFVADTIYSPSALDI
jgi:hypothetical protein